MSEIDYNEAKEADKLLDDSYVDYILIYQEEAKAALPKVAEELGVKYEL